MHVVKLAGIAARVAECSNDSAVAPMNDPDYIVFSIGHEQILLAFVARESEVIREPMPIVPPCARRFPLQTFLPS